MALAGSPMTRNHIPDLLELGVRKVYIDTYDQIESQYERVFNVKQSRKKTETEVITAGLGLFQMKSEGASPFFDNGQEAWSKAYTANTWALGIEITKEGMEDDLYDFYASMGKEIGKAAKYTQNVEAFNVFNSLSDTIYTAGGSNFTLLSTAHFRVDGGTWSNRPTVAADLSIESLETALSAWRTGMVDQRGRKLGVRPRVLMVGPSDEFVAKRILMSQQRPFSADNDPNVVRTERDLTVFVCDYLTDDGRWFLLADKAETGLCYNMRVDKEMERRDDTRTGNMLMVARYRESHGASHTYGVYGSP
jgi:phage major head subunit gpT-like protein